MTGSCQIIVDHSHCGGRRITGIERITIELFSREALAPLDIEIVLGNSLLDMVLRQTLELPFKLASQKGSILICPGFPPSPLATAFGGRVLPYIHDLFLITHAQHQNIRAKLYMAPAFRLAVAKLPRFLVNSDATRQELMKFCRPDAEIVLYRPRVRNVFGLTPVVRCEDPSEKMGPRLLALGTVEPRKNLLAAADIVGALRARGLPEARLDIVGRVGWGEDAQALASRVGVTLHGYLTAEQLLPIVAKADALISTSHDEGLGLPLLEAQYAGLQVIAPDKPVFVEVLGTSGLFVDTSCPAEAAEKIVSGLGESGWRERAITAARDNLDRWNRLADQDHERVIALIARLAALAGGRQAPASRHGR